MIQRIQSVYLFLVAALLVLAMCLPIGRFVEPDSVSTHLFKPLGLALVDGSFQSTWGLFGILLLSAITALCSIFLFRYRMMQVRMTIFSTLLLIGFYLVFLVFFFVFRKELAPVSFRIGWGLCLPIVCIILNYLAFRAIYRDEIMVRAASRLR